MIEPAFIPDEELARLRASIPALATTDYLNAGTLGPIPQVAIDAIEATQRYDHGTRQDAEHWHRLMQLQTSAREALARLTGVSVEQFALMHSTHEGINACVWGLDLRAGDELITTNEEHPGLLVPLRHVQDRCGAVVRIANWDVEDAAFVDAVVGRVTERTRAVLLSHVSWISGRIAPIRALRDALPDSVRIIVDGAQSAGAMVVSPDDGWDAYTVSGQKWPCGPNGTGGLALIEPGAWLPTYGAYMQVTSWDDCLTAPLATDGRRFETSQEALPPLAGIAASVRWLDEQVGVARAHAHARACNAYLRTVLTEQSIVAHEHVHGFDHLCCIDVNGDALGLATAMLDAGVLIRAVSTSRLRVSFGYWTTREELDSFASTLATLLER